MGAVENELEIRGRLLNIMLLKRAGLTAKRKKGLMTRNFDVIEVTLPKFFILIQIPDVKFIEFY